MDYVNNYNYPNMFTKDQVVPHERHADSLRIPQNVVRPENNILTVPKTMPWLAPLKPLWLDFKVQTRVVCASGESGFQRRLVQRNTHVLVLGFPQVDCHQRLTETHKLPMLLRCISCNAYGNECQRQRSTRTKAGVVFELDSYVETKPWGYHEGF